MIFQKKANSGNIIKNITLKNIGDKHTVHTTPTYSALALYHSSNNLVENIEFINIESEASPHGLHPVYAAHFSDNNIIKDSVFMNYSGDAIKFRDSSNYGIVENNTFENNDNSSAIPELSLAFYPVHKLSETNPREECPPIGVVFKNNYVKNNYEALGRSYPFINDHFSWQRDYDLITKEKIGLAANSIIEGSYCAQRKSEILNTEKVLNTGTYSEK